MAANCPLTPSGARSEEPEQASWGSYDPQDAHLRPTGAASHHHHQGTPTFARHSCCNARAHRHVSASAALTAHKSEPCRYKCMHTARHTICADQSSAKASRVRTSLTCTQLGELTAHRHASSHQHTGLEHRMHCTGHEHAHTCRNNGHGTVAGTPTGTATSTGHPQRPRA